MDIYEYVFMGHVSGVRVDHVISLHEECLADLQVGVDTTYAKRAKEAFMACAWPLCPEKQAWTEKQAQQLREMVAE